MTKLWGAEAGRATKTDRILVLGATEAGRRRALAGAATPVDWEWPPRGLRATLRAGDESGRHHPGEPAAGSRAPSADATCRTPSTACRLT